MARTVILAAAMAVLCWPGAAFAADRSIALASFDKVRVLGPFEVVIAKGPSGAVVSGDRAVIDTIEVQVDGATLTVRNRIERWQQQPHAGDKTPVIVTIGAPATLVSASVIGGGRLTVGAMKGARLDLAVTGAGAITVADAQADATYATLIGTGAIGLAGRSGEARLMTNGSGTIDADRFDVGDLMVRLDGPGATRARARFTARVTNTGLGQVAVAGHPKCSVTANAGGPVACIGVR